MRFNIAYEILKRNILIGEKYMTEFNNIGSGEIKKVQNLNFEGSKNAPSVQHNYEQKEIKNLDNAHSALVGRSMIKKSPLAGMNPELIAGVRESVASFKGNERIIALGDKIFDAAIAKGLSYEQAAKMQAEAIEHFKG